MEGAEVAEVVGLELNLSAHVSFFYNLLVILELDEVVGDYRSPVHRHRERKVSVRSSRKFGAVDYYVLGLNGGGNVHLGVEGNLPAVYCRLDFLDYDILGHRTVRQVAGEHQCAVHGILDLEVVGEGDNEGIRKIHTLENAQVLGRYLESKGFAFVEGYALHVRNLIRQGGVFKVAESQLLSLLEGFGLYGEVCALDDEVAEIQLDIQDDVAGGGGQLGLGGSGIVNGNLSGNRNLVVQSEGAVILRLVQTHNVERLGGLPVVAAVQDHVFHVDYIAAGDYQQAVEVQIDVGDYLSVGQAHIGECKLYPELGVRTGLYVGHLGYLLVENDGIHVELAGIIGQLHLTQYFRGNGNVFCRADCSFFVYLRPFRNRMGVHNRVYLGGKVQVLVVLDNVFVRIQACVEGKPVRRYRYGFGLHVQGFHALEVDLEAVELGVDGEIFRVEVPNVMGKLLGETLALYRGHFGKIQLLYPVVQRDGLRSNGEVEGAVLALLQDVSESLSGLVDEVADCNFVGASDGHPDAVLEDCHGGVDLRQVINFVILVVVTRDCQRQEPGQQQRRRGVVDCALKEHRLVVC